MPKKPLDVVILDRELLRKVTDARTFIEAAVDGGMGVTYEISGALKISRDSMNLIPGENSFVQCGDFSFKDYLPFSSRHRIELDYVPLGIFSPFSHSIFGSNFEVHESSVDVSGGMSAALQSMTKFDPMFSLHREKVVIDSAYPLDYSDDIVMPICGPGYPNFGHFLYDGLGLAVFLSMQNVQGLKFVGAAVRPWQTEIMKRLGIQERFFEINKPTRFRGIIASSMLYGHLPSPTRFIRPVFDLLRLTVGRSLDDPGKKIYISRGEDKKRPIANREELELHMARRGYVVLNPDKLGLDETIQKMASARIVVGESGAGMANIGFCETGLQVLEIQRPGFMDGWTRATCDVMGFDWSVYLASDEQDLTGNASHHEARKIDIEKFSRAVDVVESRMSA